MKKKEHIFIQDFFELEDRPEGKDKWLLIANIALAIGFIAIKGLIAFVCPWASALMIDGIIDDVMYTTEKIATFIR